MSPKTRHIPEDARRTSVCLTAEDNAAINWISESRRIKRDDRWRMNDILVDALWYFLEKTEGKTKEQMRAMVPQRPALDENHGKVTEMPKSRGKG